MMYVQADTAFRGISSVMAGLLKLLADFWVCELSWIALYCCEASEWVLRLTRGVCSWDCMSSQKGERDRISVGHVERIRKEKFENAQNHLCWKYLYPQYFSTAVKTVSWYSVFCSALQVFAKCMAEVSHMPLEIFYVQNCNMLAF